MGRHSIMGALSFKRGFQFILTAFLFILMGCGSSKEGGPTVDENGNVVGQIPSYWQPLDVSDVAYLWPQMSQQNFSRLLPMVSQQPSQSLIPNLRMIQEMVNFSQGRSRQNPTNFDLFNVQTQRRELVTAPSDSWGRVRRFSDVRIVSFRVENCGDGMGDGHGSSTIDQWVAGQGGEASLNQGVAQNCLPMFRLVGQPISGDTAIHLIYQYQDPSVMFQMMDDLQKLKGMSPVSTDGASLGVHPGLAAENGVGQFSEQVKFFIQKYARADRLIKVAFLATDEIGGGSEWNFFEAKITNNQPGNFQWEMVPLLALQGNPISQGFNVGQSTAPRLRSLDLANLNGARPEPRVLEASVDPTKTFASSMDCKSCHASSVMGARLASLGQNQFRPYFATAEQVFHVEGITSIPDSRLLPTDERNFRAFGWFQGPVVTVRVAKKAGATAASMNQQFFGSQEGQGLRCQGQEHRLLRCVLRQAGRPNNCIERICNN